MPQFSDSVTECTRVIYPGTKDSPDQLFLIVI